LLTSFVLIPYIPSVLYGKKLWTAKERTK